MPNINGFEVVVHGQILFVKNSPFLSLKWPQRGQPLDLTSSESSFPRDASYQTWLKLI